MGILHKLMDAVGLGSEVAPLTPEEAKQAEAAFQDADYATALPLLERGAKAEDAQAQHSLGLMYDEGWGVKQNVKRAHGLYGQAAAQGHGAALFCLGFNSQFGIVVSEDIGKARQLYEQAVEAGDVQSLVNLAALYQEGAGGVQDFGKAAEYFRRAAENNRVNGHYGYAECILDGHVPDVDRSVAIDHLVKAAEQEHSGALARLMDLYAENDGKDFEVEQEKILDLAKLGAEIGDPASLMVHVASYWSGIGRAQDQIKAYEEAAVYLALHLEDPNFQAEVAATNLERMRAPLSDDDLEAGREAVAKNAQLEALLILAHIYGRRMGSDAMPSLEPDEEEAERWIEISFDHHGPHSRRYVGMFNGRRAFSDVG